MPKIQLKLMAGLMTLVAAIVAATGAIAESRLRRDTIARIENSLGERAELVSELMAPVGLQPGFEPQLTDLAQSAAQAAHARVTLIDPRGQVLADSDVAATDLHRVDNHGDRPEVIEAFRNGRGIETRKSKTVGRSLLYFAVRMDGPHAGVVRLSKDLDEVDAAVHRLRQDLAAAGAVGVVLAFMASFGVSRLVVRPLQRMHTALQAFEHGELRTRVDWHSSDELGDMARAIDELGGTLEARLEDVVQDREQLRAVLGAMAEGVLVLDGRGRIALANPRLRELLQLREPVEGELPVERIRSAEIHDLLDEIADTSKPVQREITFGFEPPMILRIQGTSFPISRGGRGIVAVFHDLTEIRRLETIRRDFVANASHELKTPLTAIRGFAETLLADHGSREDRRRHLEIILAHSGRLERLVEDLLALSRAEDRTLPLDIRRVDVTEIARRVLAQLEPRVHERRIRAGVVAPNPAFVWADAVALEQVLENLLDNALKYTDPEGRVEVHVHARDDRIRIDVKDTGIGIPETDRSRIFERFYRVDKARSRRLGGTGLGLAIVKHLLQAMGSEISVDSIPGRGSTFSFALPNADSPRPSSRS